MGRSRFKIPHSHEAGRPRPKSQSSRKNSLIHLGLSVNLSLTCFIDLLCDQNKRILIEWDREMKYRAKPLEDTEGKLHPQP